MAATRASWSERGQKASLSPQTISVGAAIVPASAGTSASTIPSSYAFQTRAGTFALSATIASRNPCGTGRATQLSWNSRMKARSTGVGAPPRGLGQLQHGGVVPERPEGADEHEPERPLGVVEREPLGGVAPARVADDQRGLHADGVHEGRDVSDVVGEPVAVRRMVGVAVAALRRCVRVEGPRKSAEQGLPRAPRVGEAVQQDDRQAVRVAVLDVGERDAARERNALLGGDHRGPFWARRGPGGCGRRPLGPTPP
jgi:hypothetical protein